MTHNACRAAENELAKIQKTLPEECERLNVIVDELNIRLRNSEKDRYELSHKAESLSVKLSREQGRIEKEKEDYSTRSDEAFRRLKRSESELEETKEEKVKLMNKLSETDHSLKTLEEKYEDLESHFRV